MTVTPPEGVYKTVSTHSNLKVLICLLTFSYRHILLSNPKFDNCVLHKKTVWLQGVVSNDINVLMKHTVFSGFFFNWLVRNYMSLLFKKAVKCVSYTCVTFLVKFHVLFWAQN